MSVPSACRANRSLKALTCVLDPQSRLALDQGIDLLVQEPAAGKLQSIDARDGFEERQCVRRQRHVLEGKYLELGRGRQGFQPVLGEGAVVEIKDRPSRQGFDLCEPAPWTFVLSR